MFYYLIYYNNMEQLTIQTHIIYLETKVKKLNKENKDLREKLSQYKNIFTPMKSNSEKINL